MFQSSSARCLLLSTTVALAGAVALATGGTPALVVPTSTTQSAAAAFTTGPQARAVPALLEPDPQVEQIVREQSRAGLSCQTSLAGTPLCVHEPSAAASTGGASSTPRGGTLGCYGDGTSGPRIRAVYARPQSAPDRYDASVPAIREWAAGISSQFDASAVRTQGRRHVRFATSVGARCTLTVLEVVLPDKAFGSFRATIDALQARGLHAASSKYLVWSDGSGFCGMGTTYADDSPGLDNLNNSSLPGYARVDRRCWGKVETHELVHMLGGVQPSAPNATASYHCSDAQDVLCYDDGSAGSGQRQVCPKERAHLLDCRNDDYFSTAAPRGSYLQTHWNIARSSFLSDTATTSSPPSSTSSPRPAASPSSAPPASPSPASSPPPPSLLSPIRDLVLPTLSPVVTR